MFICVTRVAATGFVFQGYCFNFWCQEYVLCIWKTHHSLLFVLLMASLFLLPLFFPPTHTHKSPKHSFTLSRQAKGNGLVYIAKGGKGRLCSLPLWPAITFIFVPYPFITCTFLSFPFSLPASYPFCIFIHPTSPLFVLFPCSSYTNVFFFVPLSSFLPSSFYTFLLSYPLTFNLFLHITSSTSHVDVCSYNNNLFFASSFHSLLSALSYFSIHILIHHSSNSISLIVFISCPRSFHYLSFYLFVLLSFRPSLLRLTPGDAR